MKIQIVAIYIVLVATSLDAHAYLDPGTGSIILQVLIAGIISTLFALKMFWRRMLNFISGLFKGKK